MEVQNVTSAYTISISSIVKARNAQGAISVPVPPSQYLYAQLKHIKGFPAGSSQPGYSINKLRTLDNLIERLQGLKGKEILQPREETQEASIDGLIRFYQQELKKSLDTRIPDFLGSPARDQGLSLNFLV